jgi:hypothetical protein
VAQPERWVAQPERWVAQQEKWVAQHKIWVAQQEIVSHLVAKRRVFGHELKLIFLLQIGNLALIMNLLEKLRVLTDPVLEV